MRTTGADGSIEVRVGEVFGIERPGRETSGYRVEYDVPDGIAELGGTREPPSGFGGTACVVDRFRCDRPGDYRMVARERRPWEAQGSIALAVSVRCSGP